LSYRIDIQIQYDFLRVDVHGTRQTGRQAADAKDMWRTVANACERYKATRVLCVSHLHGPLPPMEAYSVANTISELFRGKSIKVAYVLLDKGMSIKSNFFGETVAANRGFSGKMFLLEQKGIDWLATNLI